KELFAYISTILSSSTLPSQDEIKLLTCASSCLSLFFFVLKRLSAMSIFIPYTTLFRSAAREQASHRLTRPIFQPIIFLQMFSIGDRKSTRLNSSHVKISYAVFCLKKKNNGIDYIIIHKVN